MVNEIGALLAPISLDDFIRSYLGKNYLFIQGNHDKFSKLLSWTDYNIILSHHKLDFPQIRLAKNGTSIPSQEYISYSSTRRGTVIPKLNSVIIAQHLRKGATLIVDGIDELHKPIDDLAKKFEKCLNENFRVNAYAGWGSSRGFDIHWDDHDVLILQVHGHKDWKIFGKTREAPLYRDVEFDKNKPNEPIWEKRLSPGDILYIPRGCWHVANPINEPTLHLTFGFTNRTGIDIFDWLKEKLIQHEGFRKDIPKFSTEDEFEKYWTELNKIFANYWSRESFPNFINEHDATIDSRVKFNLPWEALESPFLEDNNLKIRFSLPRKIKISHDHLLNEISFSAIRKKWRFHGDSMYFFKLLMENDSIAVEKIISGLPSEIEVSTARDFLSELLFNKIIEIVEDA